MFNADLALSVTMTAVSTICSIVMLPLNIYLYTATTFDADVLATLNWSALFQSIIFVVSAVGLGLLASAKVNSHRFNLYANKLGNLAGLALILVSVLASTSGGGDQQVDQDVSSVWDLGWKFYLGVATPCFLAVVVSTILSTALKLRPPERV